MVEPVSKTPRGEGALSCSSPHLLASLSVWGIYGVVETLLTSYLPFISSPAYSFHDNPCALAALLFLLYPLAGAVQGTLLSLWAKGRAPREGKSSEISLSLLVFASVYALYCLFQGAWTALLPLFLLFLFRKRDLSPWAAVFLLVGSVHLWGARPLWSPLLRGGLITLLLLAGLLSSPLLKRLFSAQGLGGRFLFRPTPLSLCPLLLVLVGGLFFFVRQEPPLPSGIPERGARGSLPPIFLILWDTVRADHLSPYGYSRPTTPHLERFVKEGATLYRNHYALSNYTLPTHATLFTGVEPVVHRAFATPRHPLGLPFADRFETLPLFLKRLGYLNMAFVANYGYLSKELDFSKGFLYYDDRSRVTLLGVRREYFFREGARRALIGFFGSRLQRLFRTSEELVSQSLKTLGWAIQRGTPFFFYNLMDAHHPYLPPEPFRSRFGDPSLESYWMYSTRVLRDPRALTPEEKGRMKAFYLSQYDGALAYLDHWFGLFLEGLKSRGLYDKSLIILVSDHGEAFGEGERYGHNVTLEDHQIKVPLVVKYPGQRETAVVEEVASQLDLLPTIADVVGAKPPAGLSGRSLRGELEPARAVVSESYIFSDSWGEDRRCQSEEAVELRLTAAAGKRDYLLRGETPREREEPFAGALNRYLDLRNQAEGKETKGKAPSKEALDKLRSLGYL